MPPQEDPSSPNSDPGPARLARLDREIAGARRKLELIRGKQKAWTEWERARRPIRIGFIVVIPIVLLIEAIHLYRTLDTSQGSRAPWLMLLATLAVVILSVWYYRQARSQRDGVLKGYEKAVLYADRLELQIRDFEEERDRLKSSQ